MSSDCGFGLGNIAPNCGKNDLLIVLNVLNARAPHNPWYWIIHRIYVRKDWFVSVTMMDFMLDGELYKLVSHQNAPKKAHMDHVEATDEENKTETLLLITFKKPLKTGTEINVAANVIMLLDTMMKADPMLAVLTLDRQATFHPKNNALPSNEDKFKHFFLVHPQSSNPAFKNQISIGCILRSTKSVADIKATTIDNVSILDWLHTKKIFIKTDNLGHDTTKVVGILLCIHPEKSSRKHYSLTFKTSPSIRIKSSTWTKWPSTTTSMPWIVAIISLHMFHHSNLSRWFSDIPTRPLPLPLEPLPFKCNTPHYVLLRELFSLLFTKPSPAIAHIQFSLSGIIMLIGPGAYCNLLQDNNKYFNNLITVPVAGVWGTYYTSTTQLSL